MSSSKSAGGVIVSVPHFGCRKYVRRAVLSVLSQTYPNVQVAVVNDGDPEPPWSELDDIQDPRLIRFELPTNHGPYFVTDCLLGATEAEYLLIQDADDWSEPDRVEKLFALMHLRGRGAANSGHYVDAVDPTGSPSIEDLTYRFERPITDKFSDRTRHHGLYRTSVLREVGGYYGGFRAEYDRFIGNMLHLIGELDYTTEPLYHRSSRPGSLTQSSETGHGSAYRNETHLKLKAMYLEVLAVHRKGGDQLTELIRRVSERHVEAADRRYLTECSNAMRPHLKDSTPGVVRLFA